MKWVNCVIVIQLLYVNWSLAQNLSTAEPEKKYSPEAASEAQALMKNSSERQQLLQTSEAKKADQEATAVVGSENVNEIYGISADILPIILKKNDDTQSAENYLEKAQRNPAQFLQELPPEIQNRIKSLSQKVEQKKIQSNKSQVP